MPPSPPFPPPPPPPPPRPRRAPRAGRAAAALLSALLSGCTSPFTPGSVITDLRVLALVTTPPEVGPGQTVTVQAVTAAPGDAPPATARWSACPFSAGATAAYACVLPACETPLTPAADGTVTLDPVAVAQACLSAAGGSLPGAPPGTGLPATLEVIVRYVATDGAGLTREAIQRIPVTTQGPPPQPNLPPVFQSIEVGGAPAATSGIAGTLPAGGSLPIAVAIDPASIQQYTDASGALATEEIVVSFYTTAGRFTLDRGLAPTASTSLQSQDLPAGATEALLWVVASDLRGGEAAAGPFRIALGP